MKTRKQRGGLSPAEWERIKPILLAHSYMNADKSYSVSYKTVLPFLEEILGKKDIDKREIDLISALIAKNKTSFNFDSESTPLLTEPALEKRLVYVLGENHREQTETTEKLIEITLDEPEFLLFTESTSIIEKRAADGVFPCIPIPYSVENLVMILTFFYGVKIGDQEIKSFKKLPSDMIQLLIAKELGIRISKKQILTEPDSVIDIVKTRIAELCKGPGETAFLILSQLPSITYSTIDKDIKSHPIVKASLRLVDELIIENIKKEDGRPKSTVFIIIVGQNHCYNLDEKLSALGYLVKTTNHSEVFYDELGLSGGKRKKRRTKRKRRKI